MRIGFGAPVAGAWATPLYLGSFAERAEALGYASLWSFQRLLVPEGSGMEPVYRSVLDPLVALGFLAARTSRIRLGVATICLPYVSPAVLAKQATTVDVLSGGRLDLGLGIGWMPEDLSKISEAVAVVREAASAAGRDPAAVRIICRGVVHAGEEAEGPDGGRRLLSGSFEQIREDTAGLSEQGVTELFYDLNWDPRIGSPSVTPEAAAERAGEILAALAPR